jgi:tight adherence protein C
MRGAVAAGSIAAGFASFGLAAAPPLERPTLGSRGKRRLEALAVVPYFALVEPLVRWMGGRAAPLVSSRAKASLDRRLVFAGEPLGLVGEELFALHALGALAGAAATALQAHFAGGLRLPHVGWLAAGLALPWLLVASRVEKRREALVRGLPYVADLLALAMTAGLDFPGAVRNVVDRSSDPSDPLTRELERLLHALGVGVTRQQALLELIERTNVASVEELARAIIQAEERGTPLADALVVQAGVARLKRSTAGEEAAARAAVALYVPLTLLLLTVMILLLTPLVLDVLQRMR